MHGSSYHVTSVQNPHSIYGSPDGLYSPYNPYSIQPPVIIYQNQIVLTVSKNPYVVSDVSVIDPDILFSVYNSGKGTHSPTSILDAYTQARIANQNFLASLHSNGIDQT